MDILQACDLKKTYGTGEACVHALDGVSLNVEKGEFVAIVGTSGSGKSTLLHMLGGLDRPSSGKVFVDGKDIFSLKDEELTIFRRRKIGFVFQAYNLVPVLNVYENIVLPIELDGRMFKLYMYTAIAPIPISTFAGEPSQSVGKNFIKSYAGVCLEGAIIALACIIFSVYSASPPAIGDTSLSAVTIVWNYVGELVFNLLVLVGAVKASDRIVKEMMGL